MSTEPLPRTSPSVVQIQTRWMTTDQLRDTLTRNPRYAARWIETAAKAGMIPAQIVWGQLLLDGHGVAGDPKAAFSWFKTAAAKGDAEARNMMGRCYEQGWGVAADPRRATESFEIAAKAGHLWGQVNLAQMLMRAGAPEDRPRCFALFKAAAECGTLKANLKAMNSLARFFEEGWGGPSDPAGAVFWYLKAANLGDHWAQYNLATILFRRGDHDAADKWLRSAIAISDNGFRRRIASALLARPEPALRQRGVNAVEHCARAEAPEDLYAYALALDEGIAGTRDPIKAERLFKAAAAKGHLVAAERMRAMSLRKRLRLSAFIRAGMRRFARSTFQSTLLPRG